MVPYYAIMPRVRAVEAALGRVMTLRESIDYGFVRTKGGS